MVRHIQLSSLSAPLQQAIRRDILARKSDIIDTQPTQEMIKEALLGLKWRKEHNRGGTQVGVSRARDISNKRNLSHDTIKRMHSYFARHEVDKKANGFKPGEDGYPSNGRIAWALWGGDAGWTWAKKKLRQFENNKAD